MKLLLWIIFITSFSAATGQSPLSYIFKLGDDTAAYEQYTRYIDRVEGRILSLSPEATVTQFLVRINNGVINSFESKTYKVLNPDEVILQRNLTISDTLADHRILRLGKLDSNFSRSYKASLGAVPMLDYDVSMYEQMLDQLKSSGTDSISFKLLSSAALNSYMKKKSTYHFESKYFLFPISIQTDQQNKIMTLDATASTVKTIGQKIPNFDFDVLVGSYADKERKNGARGPFSPDDTITTLIKGSELRITYGRPFLRGRTIFGNVVPYEKVWRTGANYATHFSTSKDLSFDTFTLPAGRYTLWVIPSLTVSKLIISKTINIFGTQYRPAGDLVKLDMNKTELSRKVDQFTIVIEENNDGEIKFRWGKTEYNILFKVKQ